MKYLLDTNFASAYLNNAESLVRTRMQMLKPSEILLCSVVEAELYYGVMKSATPSNSVPLGLPQRLFLDFLRDHQT
jgi:tRNA(fMet)-specific endonuclease VapC